MKHFNLGILKNEMVLMICLQRKMLEDKRKGTKSICVKDRQTTHSRQQELGV